MHPIKIADNTTLVFQVRPGSKGDNFDLNFYDQSRHNAVFHMVLRRESDTLVCNTLHNGQWGSEEAHPCHCPETAPGPVQVRFDRKHVTVEIAGTAYSFEMRDGHTASDIRFMLHAPVLVPHSRIVAGQAVYWGSPQGAALVEDKQVARINRVDPPARFMLGGMIPMPLPANTPCRLVCNDAYVEAAVILHDPDANAPPPENTGQRFEIELPGYLWTHGESSKPYFLQVEFDGKRYPSLPIALTREDATEWLEEIATGPLGKDPYWALLALEHGHFLQARRALSEVTRAFLQRTAQTYGLEDYLEIEPSSVLANRPALAAPQQPSGTSLSMQLHWQALREFNAGLATHEGREHLLLQQLLTEYRFSGEQRDHFIENVTPYFCAAGGFQHIAHLLSPARVQRLAASDSMWSTSLALPYLVAQDQLDAAIELLLRLSSLDGWVNTACIEQASHAVRTGEHVTFGIDQAEKFAYALIDLLGHMRDDYWSRLHDRHLIQALLGWLETPTRWRHCLTSSLVKAAQRLYGLSPTFWQAFAQLSSARHEMLADLRQAARRCTRLRTHVPDRANWPANAQTMRDDLAHFLRLDNAGALQVLRELTCHQLQDIVSPDGLLRGLAYDLVGTHPDEALRLAAFPGPGDAGIAAALPGLRQTVMLLHGEIDHSPRYALQREASRLLAALPQALTTHNNELVHETVRALIDVAENLSEPADLGLGADLLAAACQILPADHVLISRLEHAIGPLLALILQHTPADAPPSQPLLATLSRLANGHAGLRRLALLVEQSITHHFGAAQSQTVQRLLAKPSELRMQQTGPSDTLVVVYSCQAYLETRIPAIRRTWMSDLQVRGIPCIVMTGGGDDTLDGDVLRLAVGDRYEDLPQKTLKMVQWVLEHTDFQYLLKIDDDCYLNVDEYFDTLSHRRFHYYGRRLQRQLGNMDRAWHHDKSQGERAARALDKSPEPSTYADGGSGYSLSRLAMQSLIDAQRTTAGKRLVASSFMEDKLVGDLLALRGILTSNEDYYILVRRRLFSKAMPINIWGNHFYPSRSSPTKLAHLDTDAHMDLAQLLRDSDALWPKKIWPSYSRPTLAQNINQLELLTHQDKVQALLANDLVVVAVMRNEMIMLPHFLAHYRALGVHCFIVVDNTSTDGTREHLFDQSDVILYSSDTEYRHSHYGVAWQQAVLANHCIGKWVLLADADELLIYPGYPSKPLMLLAEELEVSGCDAACVMMVDMYPRGDLAEADFSTRNPFEAAPWFDAQPLRPWRLSTGYYSNAHSYTSALRHRLMPDAEPYTFTSQKYCLLKYAPWMRLSEGLHYVAEIIPSAEPLWFAHFKYHAAFKEKVEAEVRRKQHYDNAQEYQKYLNMLTESGGNFFVEGISRRLDPSIGFIATDDNGQSA